MDTRYTVCLINDSFPPCIDGVATTVVNYARLLPESGISPVVVTPDHPEADDSAYPFPVIRYPSLDTEKTFGYRAGNFLSAETLAAVERQQPALIHSHCPITSTFLARLLRRTLPMPLILTYHSKFEYDVARIIRGKLIQEEALRLLVKNISACDEVWCVSRGAGEALKGIGYEGDYIVMPNGVDLPKGRVADALIEEVTAGYDLPQDVPCFLYVGRMMWYKGLRINLDACAALHEKDVDFRMVFVGGGGEKEAVMSYAKELGLYGEGSCGKVIFVDPVYDRERLRAWYARADLFLFPSTYDTNGLVVREAAASYLPSVLIKGSCAAEDSADGEDGFLIEENAPAMTSLLEELCRRPEKLRDAGEAACRNLYLSWEDSVKNAAARYEIVLENYRRGLYPLHDSPDDVLFNSVADLLSRYNQRRSQEYAARKRLQKFLKAGERASAWTDFFAQGYDETGELLQEEKKAHPEHFTEYNQEDWNPWWGL